LGHDIAISDEQLVKVLNELPPDRRDIILLAFFLGMIDREIAEQLDLVRQTAGQKPFRS
jgi:DNA-directed RNA polymerase specialized sigma24 family protein